MRSVCIIVGDHASVGKYEDLDAMKAVWPSKIELETLNYRTLSWLVAAMVDEKRCELRRETSEDIFRDGHLSEEERMQLVRHIVQQTFKVRTH